jgi:hypothetical protein
MLDRIQSPAFEMQGTLQVVPDASVVGKDISSAQQL